MKTSLQASRGNTAQSEGEDGDQERFLREGGI